ncbi:MAG: peptidoglycan editing factor PgeF [Lachnospiraceae bacterium]|nr:peptidoglycan editing factor PgeF [Lachnospiraceae bacterium]
MKIKRIPNDPKTLNPVTREGVPLLEFQSLREVDFITHCFSTRMGGVSGGIYESMNFKEDGTDLNENIRANYRIISRALGVDVRKIVRPSLVHGTSVHEVKEEDFGVGALAKSTLVGFDGLITNLPGVTLAATFADCVPLYFVDIRHHAVGLAHSGWRGTCHRIAWSMLEAMKEAYGTEPGEVLAAIGPCICGDCYEVGEELDWEFQKGFAGEIEERTGISYREKIMRPIVRTAVKKEELPRLEAQENAPVHSAVTENFTHLQTEERKFLLDLRQANLQSLLAAGVKKERIAVADICTCCNPQLIFSHRATGGRRGTSAAFLGIRE